MSERHAAEQELARVRQLSGDVLHDVNNVFGTVLAAAHLIDSSADDPRAVRLYVRQVVDAVAEGRERLTPLRAVARGDGERGSPR